MKKAAAIILVLLGIFMLYFGLTKSVTPPAVTGVGFLVIALVFLAEKK